MTDKVVLVIYGRGGHKEEMRRLILNLKAKQPDFKFVSIADVADSFGAIKHYTCPEPRDKFNNLTAPFQLAYSSAKAVIQTLKLASQYKVSGIISTGPGMAVLPSILFRLMNKKVIFIEDWSRFYSGSLTGKAMYRIANVFYVQNKALLKHYPKAIFSGRL